MQCAFVNTDQPAKRVMRLGMFYYTRGHDGQLVFRELCEIFYPHPDAPDYAEISVYRFLPVSVSPEAEAIAVLAIDAVRGISKLATPES